MSLNQFNWIEDYDSLFEEEIPSQLLQNPLLQKDIWRTREDLGLEIQEHQKILTFNFNKIQPRWLNLLAKIYVLKRASLNLSVKSIKANLSHLRTFAKFIKEKHIDNPKYLLDSQLFEELDNWIRAKKKKRAERTILSYYTTFNTG